ncbi:MAG TPA: hypothetical protein VJT72_12195 [Pseudonocardiaceae bacterium]|nr:hypothetical protein [Pseudonocardiaceae bacterium]
MAVMDYRTQDGLADYGFSIEFRPDLGWRVYIVFEPFQQGHSDSLKPLYQSIDGDGRRYVDWSSKLDNLGDAKKVAELWAEMAQGYRRAQEKNALYLEQIRRHRRSREQRKASPDAVGADGTGAGHLRVAN